MLWTKASIFNNHKITVKKVCCKLTPFLCLHIFIVSAVWNWLVEIRIEIWSRLYYIDIHDDDGTAVPPEIWSRLYYIDIYDDDGTAVPPEIWSRLHYIDIHDDDGTAVLPEIWSRLHYIDIYDDDGTAVLPEISSDSVEPDLRDK